VTSPSSVTPGRSLVIPMWNEAARIGTTVAAIADSPLANQPLHLILADDGSTDSSCVVADAALSKAVAGSTITGEVLSLPHSGKGGTVRAGILRARTEYVAFTDADLAAPPEDINRVFAALEAGRGDVVAGIRTSDGGDPAPPMRQAARLVMRSVVRGLGLTKVPDTQCGLKAFTHVAAQAVLTPLQTDGFAFDVELLARAERLGLRIHSEPVAWRHGEGSTVHLASAAPAMVFQMLVMMRDRRSWPTRL